jgi:hypothetical protein
MTLLLPMSLMPIDLDAEAILFDGQWNTRDDLARRIKAMLDAGDYAISRQSGALEQLTQTLAAVRTLAFRATPDLVEALNMAAARSGKSVGGFIRDTLIDSIAGAPEVPQARPNDAAAAPRAKTDELPAALAAAGVIAGPGALKAAGVPDGINSSPSVVVEPALAHETAVELTNPKKREKEKEKEKEKEADEGERRWFNP